MMGWAHTPNTAYTLWAYALALRDIAPFGRNVVYAGNVRRNAHFGQNMKVKEGRKNVNYASF